MWRMTLLSAIVATVFFGGAAQAQDLFDMTAPGDPIIGIPDDGDWPGAETPDLAIDDVVSGSKYLHFKGANDPMPDSGGAGFRVTPTQNQFVVTALNFASANDAAPRDPVSFRLSGSNESIDGPYTLIAEGTIDEFNAGTAYARNTWLTTPIEISSRSPYLHYELIFTEVRDRAAANSMQIGDVELLTDGSMGGSAGNPAPENEATDVLRDVILTWAPSPNPSTHSVYFGSDFDDVNTATAPTEAGLDVNSLDVGRLDFGVTYFWRIDEVNTSPDKTVFKGDVWSFSVEPYSILVPGEDIIVTASSISNEFSIPENTINGSGLDADGAHSIVSEAMWFTGTVDLDPWIQYELNGVKKLDTAKVWNSNSAAEMAIGWGIKDVEIVYSVDGENWTVLEGATQFSRAPGSPAYTQADEIAFDGVPAKFVRFNIASNWGGILMSYSLSEVQFNVIPAQARTPEPADGGTDVVPNAVFSWRAGRKAAKSTIFVGTDQTEVADGLAPSVTSNTNSVDVSSLDLQMDTVYYLRVDEVNEAEAISTWAGPVWSFTTAAALIVDDFESYNNISPDRPFQAWLDGFGYSSDEFFPTAFGGNGTGAGIGHDIWSLSSPQYDGDIMETSNTIAG
ncbi:MAG: discoidin domain-containing protein, partial [Phycisphaeraceae bacterium]|nr:discoidin domain-containing protein [Phycisphaeraceae bacterium]